MITGCSPDLDTKVKNLVESKNKWIKSAPNRNYSYTYKHQCHHCIYNNQNIIIKVQNGNVVSVLLENGDSIRTKHFKSIKQQFEYILEILKKEEREKSATIKVEYNKTLGYPSEMNINIKNLSNGRRAIYISNVKINKI